MSSLDFLKETSHLKNLSDKSNPLRLIELKTDLINLNNLNTQNDFSKNSNMIDSLKKLESYHEKKLQLFKSRILFFESYLINNLNKNKAAMRQVNTNRLISEELDEKKGQLKSDMDKLRIEKDNFRSKLDRYEKHFKFIQDSLSYFQNHQCADLTQIINRFDSLKFTQEENEKSLSISSDNFVNMRTVLFNSIGSFSDELLYIYEFKSLTESKLKHLRQLTSDKNEINAKNFEALVEKLITFDKILKSIDNLFELTNHYSKVSNKNSILMRKFDLKNCNNDPKKLATKIIKFKLDSIKQNFNYLKEISNF